MVFALIHSLFTHKTNLTEHERKCDAECGTHFILKMGVDF